MKERKKSFTTNEVRAILDGRKSQFREVVKFKTKVARALGQAHEHKDLVSVYPASVSGWVWWSSDSEHHAEFTKKNYKNGAECPYGVPGDMLWVQETHGIQLEPCEDYPNGYVIYKADLPDGSSFDYVGGGSAWRSSVQMPRWASRITLEIVRVRVERIQDISEDDISAEGVPSYTISMGSGGASYKQKVYQAFPDREGGFFSSREAFSSLWDSINKKRGFGWNVNPWVWVIEFKADIAERKINE